MFQSCWCLETKSKDAALDISAAPAISPAASAESPTGSNFEGQSERNVTTSSPPKESMTRFVIECVGATGLSTVKEDIDTFCVIKTTHNDKKIHRTRTIPNDTAPIWSIKTKSICFVDLEPGQGVAVGLCRTNPNPILAATQVVTQVISMSIGEELLGAVELSYDSLLESQGDRTEFHVSPKKYAAVTLALRFRRATLSDYEAHVGMRSSAMGPQKKLKDHAGDTDFRKVSSKSVLNLHTKRVSVDDKKEKAYRVWPFPDPDNPKDTEFMTKPQLRETSLRPSKHWVEATGGSLENFGSIFLEVLGCDDLPNMDTELVNGLTDAFVACAYEDNFVRSSVIHDSLHPRWMPWSDRAFQFHIQHPTSILFLGVFDYDKGLLDLNDPIGRVAIVPTLFEKDTMYTLTYPLYHCDNQTNPDRGTVTIRLRIHWKNPSEASKAQLFLRPPRFFINVETEKAWKTLRYLTRGSVDLANVTVESVKVYVSEMSANWKSWCFVLDVVAGIFLWRGRSNLSFFGRWNVWFPIHSISVFVACVLAVEYPVYAPSILLYLIAYSLLCNNYSLSSHPSPWARVRSFTRSTLNNHFNFNSNQVRIEPGTGDEQGKLLERLDEYRALRVSSFVYAAAMGALKLYRVYSKNTPVDISTVEKSGNLISKFYVNYLSYVHLALRMLCKYIRLLKNFVNWRTGGTYKFTVDMLLFAAAWALFPYKHLVVRNSLRALVLILFGPQNKIVDMLWIMPYYRTTERILQDGIPETSDGMKEDIDQRPSILDPILRSRWVRKMGETGRVVVEDNVKLQAAREARYGKYSELLPAVDVSRYQSIPISKSFAQPYVSGKDSAVEGSYVDTSSNERTWQQVRGQKLYGHIIPRPLDIHSAVPRSKP